MSFGDPPQRHPVGSGTSDPLLVTPAGGMRSQTVVCCRVVTAHVNGQGPDLVPCRPGPALVNAALPSCCLAAARRLAYKAVPAKVAASIIVCGVHVAASCIQTSAPTQ